MQQSCKLLAISHWLLDTRIIEETLPHLPIPTFGRADVLNDAGGFEVGKMLLDGFAEMPIFAARAAVLNVPSSASKETIFSLPFTVFRPTFFCKYDLFSLLFGRQGRGRECTIS